MKILGKYHLAVKWLMENYIKKYKGLIDKIDQNTWDKNWKIYINHKPLESNLPGEYKKYFK